MLIDPYRFAVTAPAYDVGWHFAENPTANKTVSGAPVTEHDAFVAAMGPGLLQDDLSGKTVTGSPTSPIALVAGMGEVAVLTAGFLYLRNVSSSGRFNVVGTPEVWMDCAQSIKWTFPDAAAIGLYITDRYDFPSTVTVEVYKDTVLVDSLALDANVLETFDFRGQGDLAFLSYYAGVGEHIDELRVVITQLDPEEGNDVLGFDNFLLLPA